MTDAADKRGRGRPPKPETVALRAAKAALEAEAQKPPGLIARMVRSVRNRYDAAGMGRRLAGWNPPRTSPNTAIVGQERIRERARDASRNGWAGASGVQKWTTTLVGIGITPRFKRITDPERKQAIVDLWNDFVAEADADNVLNLYGLQSLVVRTWFDGGECFVRLRRRFPDAGYPVPIQVQVLESDFVPMLDADTYPGLPDGNIIRSGIELDKRGQRIAYWVYPQHPSDNNLTLNGQNTLIRVAASQMLHVYEPKRPGQMRGVSELAPILTRLRNIEDYDDATLERQKLANLFVAFVQRTLPNYDSTGQVDPLTNQPLTDEVAEPAPLTPLAPGLFQELDDGESVTFSNPPEAGTTYSDYMRTQNMGTAAAAGIPYEVFAGDIVNVSDRTLRVIINEFRRFAEQRQWQIVIPQFCQPVVEWFVNAAVLDGSIKRSEADDARRVEHAPHGWAYIHPVQDPQGKKIEVDAGFRSRSSVIGERGDDPDAVDAERLADQTREEDLGLKPPMVIESGETVPEPAPAPAPAPAPEPAPEPAKKNASAELQAELAMAERIVALFER